MSTYPLVQVEGALAMPHMRPLNRVPPPFGREWALMPSQFSLRTELHALYAAFLRTICLSAEAFRQAYRWDRQPRNVAEPPRPAAAPVGAAMGATQAQQAAAEAIGGLAAAGGKPAPAQTPQRTQSAQAARTPPPSHKLTASAVAIGGAALLAWIVASHTQFRDDKGDSTLHATTSPAAKSDTPSLAQSSPPASAQSSTRLVDERARHDRSVSGVIDAAQATGANDASHERGVAIGSTVVAQRAATAASSVRDAGSVVAPVTPIAPITPVTPVAATRSEPAAALATAAAGAATAKHPDFKMRTASKPVQAALAPRHVSEKRAVTAKRHQAAKAARSTGTRHAVHEFTSQRGAPLVTTQRTNGMYSEAAQYSPHQFAVNSSDEYPAITTYANTRTAPRSVSRASVAADSTDWVNHVAQRRVTEVPDRFAK
ncbi:putative MAPEG superfamily protein [Paraburkholderia bannensis]|uniref:Putative MAPEG superfamily protein n=1 Tax=Paraburkholderia bannensis TaxID=765414 RepID=A0A7W9WNU6_9BURK|nr:MULTISPECIES: hypothetical protein [Paraburkholderia]MBB3255564.1 putative MAPEG superfamily protein [Paraburkholderia sp. WP4_3_2]MBB6100425.1 putative MAPEG superfamily protein [Paraburkholderia bannensis]